MRHLIILAFAALASHFCSLAAELKAESLAPGSNDVVAFIGGADVAAAGESGHLEALLSVLRPGTRFRNFGWEGHTVFAQPRDVGFPSLSEQLRRANVTFVIVQFGRAEALRSAHAPREFASAYHRWLDGIARQITNAVLVTPIPFENGGGLLPDLSKRNAELAAHASAIREEARERQFAVVDLFAEFGKRAHDDSRLTLDGLQLTPRGHALVARAFARQLGFASLSERTGEPDASGVWPNSDFEQLRQLVIARNRLWFNYWRPQNWAFLGGDRVEQPSSRDHRDPKVRWFPAEMEEFIPLIDEKEREIEKLAVQLKRH